MFVLVLPSLLILPPNITYLPSVGLAILVSLLYCCLAEWWEGRNRLYLQREAHADAQRWADADLSQDRDFPDFGDVGVVEVARPQVRLAERV